MHTLIASGTKDSGYQTARSKKKGSSERIWYVCDYVNFRLNVNLFTYHAGENVLHLWCSST